MYIADTSKHPLYHKSRLVVGAPNIACYFSVGLVLDEDVCIRKDRRRLIEVAEGGESRDN